MGLGVFRGLGVSGCDVYRVLPFAALGLVSTSSDWLVSHLQGTRGRQVSMDNASSQHVGKP